MMHPLSWSEYWLTTLQNFVSIDLKHSFCKITRVVTNSSYVLHYFWVFPCIKKQNVCGICNNILGFIRVTG